MRAITLIPAAPLAPRPCLVPKFQGTAAERLGVCVVAHKTCIPLGLESQSQTMPYVILHLGTELESQVSGLVLRFPVVTYHFMK